MDNGSESFRHFVRGMRYHDVGKPFHIGNPKHTVSGFIFLSALGMTDEALVALTHSNQGRKLLIQNLKLYSQLPHRRSTLPSYLLLGSPIDRLAASTYSYDVKLDDSPASIQNPFSRLLAETKVGKYGFQKLHDRSQDKLWEHFTEGLQPPSGDTWERINDRLAHLDNASSECVERLINALSTLDRSRLEEKLLHESSALRIFTERTYPMANDATLDEHQKLCATLAGVVYSNLKEQSHPFLSKQIAIPSENQILFDGSELPARWKCDEAYSIVEENSECLLLKISFESLRRLAESAVRLDDFHGVRQLTEGKDGFRSLFKESFRDHIGKAVGLFLGNSDDVFFPLNEFPTDLIYLLPKFLKDEQIEEAVLMAQQDAAEGISQYLEGRIKADFRETSLSFHNAQQIIKGQMLKYPLGILIERVQLDTHIASGKFKKHFADKMGDAYKKVSMVPTEMLQGFFTDLEDMNTVGGGPRKEDIGDEVCEVCHWNPVYEPLYDALDYLVPDAEQLEKIIYEFRGEPDRICLSCLANRVLSHGTVQASWLSDQLKLLENNKLVVESDPALPLVDFIAPRTIDEHGVDIGGAFARLRNGNPQVFPTIDCVADEESNVVMIEVRPSLEEGVLGDYNYSEVVARLEGFNQLKDELSNKLINTKDCLNAMLGPIVGGRTPFSELRGVVTQRATCDMLESYKKLREHISVTISKGILFKALDLMINIKETGDLPAESRKSILQEGIVDLGKSKIKDEIKSEIRSIIEDSFAADRLKFLDFYLKCMDEARERGVLDEVSVAKLHLARVMMRIRYVQDFYNGLSEALTRKRIRNLILEHRYPNLILMVPMSDLMNTLRVLHRELAEKVFSSRMYKPDAKSVLCLEFLDAILPPLLYCSVMIFKKKQPLYNVMSASSKVIQKLEGEPDNWHGVLFGLSDYRGILADQNSVHVIGTFSEIYRALEASKEVDRRSIISAFVESWRTFPLGKPDKEARSHLRNAKLKIRGKRQGWTPLTRQSLACEKIAKQVFYMRRASKKEQAP